jgi:hypothetical protein
MSIDVNVQNDLVIVTESSEDIVVNVSNAAGPQGPAGVGVPVGGTTGQVLKKSSGTNYDTFWSADNAGVPYSGATGDVDLGGNDLKAGSVFVEGATGAGGALRIKQFGSSAANLDGYSTISTLNTGVFYFTAATTSPNFKNFVLNPSGLTDNTLRTYTLPNLSGTLALLSDITPGLTSVGLSMPSAFAVSNSPLTSNGTIAVTGAGTASQYVRGDGQLATLPSGAGGGSSVNYYLNGSVNQGTIGGSVYYEMNRIPVIGTGTDFTRTNLQGDGLIAQFITDANDPNRLEIPAGAWNFEMYFNVSSAGGTPAFYLELLKYDGTTFTSISNGSTNPETITGGTAVDLYLSSLAVPQTTLLATDRLAIRVYVITSGRNITLHTEDNNLCEIITTFAGGVASLNGLTANTQYFATGTSGTDFAISSATDTHTFNLPTASATNRGALSSADWSTFSGKVGGSGVTGQVAYWNGTSSQTGSNNLFWDAANARLGIGTTTPATKLEVVGASGIQIRNGATDGFSFQQSNTNSWAWTPLTSGSNYIIQNANVGIGTSSPQAKLDVLGGAIRTSFSSGNAFLEMYSGGSAGYIEQKNANPLVTIVNGSERMRLTPNGRLLLGTATESTFLLDVNGTARITGGTFSHLFLVRPGTTVGQSVVDIDTSAFSGDRVPFSVKGHASQAYNFLQIGKSSADDIFKIASTGAATFSSSVTAANAVFDRVANDSGSILRIGNATTYYDFSRNASTGALSIQGNQTGANNIIIAPTSGNLLVGTTFDNGSRLQVTGAATISSSVTASSGVFTSTTAAISASNGGYISSIARIGGSNSGNIFSNNGTGSNFIIAETAANVYGIGGGGIGGAFNGIGISLNTTTGATAFSNNVNIGGGTANASAILQADSNTKGFLPPRMTSTQRAAISSPAVGLIVYQTDATEGLYVYKSTGWTFVI